VGEGGAQELRPDGRGRPRVGRPVRGGPRRPADWPLRYFTVCRYTSPRWLLVQQKDK